MKAVLNRKNFFLSVCLLFALGLSAQRNPVSWQGQSKMLEAGKYLINISAEIQNGWYVYSQHLESDMGPVATSIEFASENEIVLEGETKEEGNRKEGMDKAFGMNVVRYLDNVTFSQKIVVPDGTKSIECIVTFMTCNGEMCLPPKDVPVRIEL